MHESIAQIFVNGAKRTLKFGRGRGANQVREGDVASVLPNLNTSF